MRRWEKDPHYWKNPALRRSREKHVCERVVRERVVCDKIVCVWHRCVSFSHLAHPMFTAVLCFWKMLNLWGYPLLWLKYSICYFWFCYSIWHYCGIFSGPLVPNCSQLELGTRDRVQLHAFPAWVGTRDKFPALPTDTTCLQRTTRREERRKRREELHIF